MASSLFISNSWQAGASCEACGGTGLGLGSGTTSVGASREASGGTGRGLGSGTTSAAAPAIAATSMISGRIAFTPAFWLE
jgi:hypothetical protein